MAKRQTTDSKAKRSRTKKPKTAGHGQRKPTAGEVFLDVGRELVAYGPIFNSAFEAVIKELRW